MIEQGHREATYFQWIQEESLKEFSRQLRIEQITEERRTVFPWIQEHPEDFLYPYHYISEIGERRKLQAKAHYQDMLHSMVEDARAGITGEDAAMIVLPEYLGKNETLLSDMKTCRVFQRFHPNAIKRFDLFDKMTLDGISVPDMMVIDDTGDLVAIVEVSLRQREEGKARMLYKYRKEFNLYKRTKKHRYFRNAEFWWVTTPDFSGEENSVYPDLKIKKWLPFTAGELRKSLQETYLEMMDEEHSKNAVSLALQMREQALEELKKAKGISSFHGMTDYIDSLLEKYPPQEEE